MVSIETTLNDAVCFERFETGRQRVRGKAWSGLLKILKPLRTFEQQVPQHEHGPTLTNDIQRPGDWAALELIRFSHTAEHTGVAIFLQFTIFYIVT